MLRQLDSAVGILAVARVSVSTCESATSRYLHIKTARLIELVSGAAASLYLSYAVLQGNSSTLCL